MGRAVFGIPLLALSLVGLIFHLRALAKTQRASRVARSLTSLSVQTFWGSLVRVYWLVAAFLCGNCLVGVSLLTPQHSLIATLLGWFWVVIYLAVSAGFAINGITRGR